MATSDIAATDMSNIPDTIKNLIPSNPVSAFCTGQHASGSCLCSYYRIYTDCCRREG